MAKIDILAISNPSIDLTYMIYTFQYDFIYGKVNDTVKDEKVKLVINREDIFIFQE